MRPKTSLSARVHGFGLVAPMFVMIVMSLVVIAMSRLSITQHGSNSLAIQQARAYQAARAGMEWGISQALKSGTCTGSPTLAGTSLSEFNVTVSCKSTPYILDNGATVRMLRLTAEAQNGVPGSRPDYAYRQLTAVVEN